MSQGVVTLLIVLIFAKNIQLALTKHFILIKNSVK